MGEWEELLDRIKEFLTGAPVNRVLATVLFTDVVGSSERAVSMGDARWKGVLDEMDLAVGRAVEQFRGSVVKSTGDGHLATFDGPGRVIQCGAAVLSEARKLDLGLGIGIHTGEVELRGDDISGIAVNLAARALGHAGDGEIVVSGVVPPLVAGSGIEFKAGALTEMKGIPGEWQLFEALLS